MASATTFSYHVPGPIIPSCNIGSASAQVNLGECEDGARIKIIVAQHDIKHDGGGGPDGFETDNIFLNAVVEISFNLVPFAGTYIDKLRAMALAGSTAGTMVAPGTLYGENSMYPNLYLPVGAAEIDGPWTFPTCRVVDPGSSQVNVKETKPSFLFRAINYFPIVSQNTIAANVLWKRTAPP